MPDVRSRDLIYASEHPKTFLFFLALGATVLWFLVTRSHYFIHLDQASFDPYYWPRRWILLPHIAASATAISVGLVQLWLGLTGRTGNLHKALGRIYVIAISVGAPAGLALALTIPGHIEYRMGLFGLDLSWVLTTAMGLLAIKLRNIPQHRAWMMRSYTVTFGFATYRVIYWWIAPHVPMPHDAGADEFAVVMAWACWSVPLLLLEVAMQLRAMLPARRAPRRAAPRLARVPEPA